MNIIMKRRITVISAFAVLLLCGTAMAWWNAGVSGQGVSADYCASQSWNTFTAFRLDFDHTTDPGTACLTSGTQVGGLNNAPGVSTPSPSTTGIGSGGNALVPDATAEYIHFDNTTSIWKSQYGELMFKVNLAGNNTTDVQVLDLIQTVAEERFQCYIGSNGQLNILWEDNNHGAVTATLTNATWDFDAGYGDWAQVHIKWDTTRCTDGTCDSSTANGDWTQAGEDELCARIRFDSNNDGDFGDGTAETWSSWVCETSAIDMGTWSTEPTTDKLRFGFVSGTFDAGIPAWVDDLEISNAQPTQ